MNAVPLKEVIDALNDAARMIIDHHGVYCITTYEILADRIEQHGIAPPDGMVLVKAKPVAWRHWHPIECDFEYSLKPVCDRCDALYIAAAPEVSA